MSSLLSMQLGPLKFDRDTKIQKYYYNPESGFIYDEKLCSIVGKKLDDKLYQLTDEDKKWCNILKLQIKEDDSFFNVVLLTYDLLEKNKGKEKEIISKLVTELTNINKETMETIRNFKTQDELIEHVKKYPKHIHDCMYNCDWKVFNLNLVKKLIELDLFNPFEKSPAYDGEDGNTNLNFYEHLKLQLQELPISCMESEMVRNRRKVVKILDYLWEIQLDPSYC